MRKGHLVSMTSKPQQQPLVLECPAVISAEVYLPTGTAVRIIYLLRTNTKYGRISCSRDWQKCCCGRRWTCWCNNSIDARKARLASSGTKRGLLRLCITCTVRSGQRVRIQERWTRREHILSQLLCTHRHSRHVRCRFSSRQTDPPHSHPIVTTGPTG